MPMQWYGEQVKAKIMGDAAKRVEYAALTLRNYLRRKLLAIRGLPASLAGQYPHYRTSHLAHNVQMEMNKATATARVGTNVPYGKWLEFGTWKMRPRPWLSRGVREKRREITRILEHKVRGG